MTNAGPNKPRRSSAEWRQLIEQQQVGNQRAKAFCQEHGLAYSTFLYYKRKLSDSLGHCGNLELDPPDEGGFIELKDLPANTHPLEVELCLGSGLVLRIRRW